MEIIPSPSIPVAPNVDFLAPGAARIRVSCEKHGARAGRSHVTEMASRSPTRLLTPRNHGKGAWIFASSLGGGLVDGDHARFEIEVEESAVALFSTQASGKVYRSPQGTSHSMAAHVNKGATVILLTDPVTCFAGARYSSSTSVFLDAGGSALLVEAFTAGRTSRGERWAFDRYEARTRVIREGQLVAHEAMTLDKTHGALGARFGAMNAFATVIALGPSVEGVCAELSLVTPTLKRNAELIAQPSPLPSGGGTVMRVAATRVEILTIFLKHTLAGLTALLGDDPSARKW